MTSQQGGARQPAGIRDVARMAGVSVATVSLALNGQPGVADDTRRRILAAAAELGYRANPQAQALRRGRTTTYGLVIRNFSNPFFLEVLSGAEHAADEAGATLLLLDSHYSLERERMLVREMAAQRLAGLAIAPVGNGRVGAALAGIAARHAGGGAQRDRRGHRRRVAGIPRQRDRGRTGHAPPRRAGSLPRRLPVRAAWPGGRSGPAPAFPAPGPRTRRAAGRHALAADDHRRAQGGRRPCWRARTPPRRSSPTPTTRRSGST